MFEDQNENSHFVGRSSHSAPFMPPIEESATPPAQGNHNMDNDLLPLPQKICHPSIRILSKKHVTPPFGQWYGSTNDAKSVYRAP